MKIYWKALALGLLADVVATITLQLLVLVALAVMDSTRNAHPITAASFSTLSMNIWLPLVGIGVAMTALGGFVAGRMAPTHKLAHGLLVGAVGLLLGFFAPSTILTWRFALSSVAAVFAGWLGGVFAVRIPARSAPRLASAQTRISGTGDFPNSEQLAAHDNWSPLGRLAPSVAPPIALPQAGMALLGQAFRASVLRRIDWARVHASPALLAALVLIDTALSIGIQRIFISGAANFDWKVIFSGWVGTLVLAWCCYLLVPKRILRNPIEPSAAQRFAIAYMVAMLVSVLCALALVPFTRLGYYSTQAIGLVAVWIVWGIPVVWSTVAAVRVLLQDSLRGPALRLFCILILAMVWGATYYFVPREYWYAAEPENSEPRSHLALTQDTFEAQQRLFAAQLAGLQPQRPGVIDLYAITFAPYAEESVFKKESAVVADVMQRRFDANGRTLQLLNHNQTTREFAWATPLNLQRAITSVAAKMDRNEDILFLHLTSHGARNGELAASFWPLEVEPVTPEQLKHWLDQAGVRNRVISISACFSGSWVDTLANDNTLVMTAADATHTSYGCGHRSALTFFGRAMYDEQLRNQTLSFEDAHKAARSIIKKREEDAGKDDGYSNPQIKVGPAMRARLALLQARLQAQRTPE